MERSGYQTLLQGVVIFVVSLMGVAVVAEEVVNVDTHAVLRTISGNPLGHQLQLPP